MATLQNFDAEIAKTNDGVPEGLSSGICCRSTMLPLPGSLRL